MQKENNIKVKTILPEAKPSFNDWCKEFKVSSMYIDKYIQPLFINRENKFYNRSNNKQYAQI
jgi:hypothetical protein